MSLSRETREAGEGLFSAVPMPLAVGTALVAVVFMFCGYRVVLSLLGHPPSAMSGAAGTRIAVVNGSRVSTELPAQEAVSGTKPIRTSGGDHDVPGAAVLGGDVRPELGVGRSAVSSLSVKPPAKRPVVAVAIPSPSPSPSPEVEDAPDVAPSSSPSPETVSDVRLHGVMSIGGIPMPMHAIYLYDFADGTMRETSSGPKGDYGFEDLRPNAQYYVISVYDSGPGMGRGARTGGRLRLSWHLAIDTPAKVGAYALDIDSGNADPEYCDDLRPTNDPVTRTPYRSWRRASL